VVPSQRMGGGDLLPKIWVLWQAGSWTFLHLLDVMVVLKYSIVSWFSPPPQFQPSPKLKGEVHAVKVCAIATFRGIPCATGIEGSDCVPKHFKFKVGVSLVAWTLTVVGFERPKTPKPLETFIESMVNFFRLRGACSGLPTRKINQGRRWPRTSTIGHNQIGEPAKALN